MTEFKEVRSKKGKIIVFGKLDEFLMETFNVKSMEEVEPNLKGSEYIVHCPFCKAEGHTKHKLYIREDYSEGHCFVCGRAFIHISDCIDTKYRTPDFKSFWNMSCGGDDKLEVVKLNEEQEWNLDKFNYEFDDDDEVGLKYLEGRHALLPQIAKILDFKYMDGNIVMPFKHNDEVFYYQIRFSGSSNIRYFFPPISAKPPYVIERDNNKKIIMCEGVFDAIALLIQAPDFTPFACMGSSISDYQLKFLKEYNPDEILIYMDETSISAKIADRLKRDFTCPVAIIKSDGEDPEEHLKYLLAHNGKVQWITSDKFFKRQDFENGEMKMKYRINTGNNFLW